MNRKLHNTTMAMIASSSLFVLGLLTSTPAAIPALTPAPAAASATCSGAARWRARSAFARCFRFAAPGRASMWRSVSAATWSGDPHAR